MNRRKNQPTTKAVPAALLTGALLLASVLIPNLAARWRTLRDRRALARAA